jgi:hypothetical protein
LRGAAFLNQLRYEFMPSVDHSFTEIAGQEYFIDAVCGWVGEIQKKDAERPAAVPSTGSPVTRPAPVQTPALACTS